MRIVAGLAVRQGFGLGQQVGQQRGMVGGMRMVAAHDADEIRGHDLRALVQGLEEAVLRVGAGPAPPHGHRVRGHRVAIRLHRLAEAFHRQLLQVVGQQLQAFVVGQHRLRCGTGCVAVPHRDQRMPRGEVAFQRRLDDVGVHRRGAGEQAFEIRHAHGERDREPDRRPQRITPTNPVPHRQDAFGGNAECRHALDVRADREQALVAAEPVADDAAVEQRFLRAEGFRDQDGSGARGIEPGQRALRGMAVDVGQEMHLEAGIRPCERIDREPRTEVGTADADADDVGDAAGFESRGQFAHALARIGGLGMRVTCGRGHREVAAQRGVQRGAALRGVHRFAVEQASQRAGEIAFAGEGEQGRQRIAIEMLAGETGVQRADTQREIGRTRRIGRDQFLQRGLRQPLRIRVEAGEAALHAACLGIERLVCVIALWRST